MAGWDRDQVFNIACDAFGRVARQRVNTLIKHYSIVSKQAYK